jgi:argininosuccinate lyase
MSQKPWKGRFKGDITELLERFSESVSFDQRLYSQDIKGSIAHARMLGEKGIIPREDSEKIIEGLRQIEEKVETKGHDWDSSLEDIHMNIEALLTKETGTSGEMLHTARSRNDQVATDLKLYVRETVEALRGHLLEMMESIFQKAELSSEVIMPGYTHLQRAQPVLLAHHLLAYFEMFRRDVRRFEEVTAGLDYSPLGSGAIAGTSLPIDRKMTAKDLGFSSITANSMDAVSDRDFAVEFLFACALCQTHLSRLAEEIILWASSEFGFIKLPDSLCTGSSMMPQKKNPDAAELVRGKTGRVLGNLLSLLVTLKGLPMTYNRDLQEDKEPVFDSADTLSASIEIMSSVIAGAEFDTDRMAQVAGEDFTTATDLAEYLVSKGLPFRQAHEITGRIVLHCLDTGCDFSGLAFDQMRSFSDLIEEDIFEAISVQNSVSAKDIPGGTAPGRVRKALEEARKFLDKSSAD